MTGGTEVAFVCMPWATTTRPSLALGILSRLTTDAGVTNRVHYPNLDLTARIGFGVASQFSNERILYGLSEHLFACDLFGADTLSSDDYLAAITSLDIPQDMRDIGFLRHLRDEVVPEFLDATVERVLSDDPAVLGVTATFNQVMADLALCARAKRRRPDIVTLAGGACFDGEMGREYHRGLPDVLDHVFLGEAEESLLEFHRRRAAGADTRGIPGVTWWDGDEVQVVPGAPLAEMDRSPVPDYDDFFAEAARVRACTGYVFNIEYLPFESSRGCWWGQKQHCVFCGINDDLMTFREKTPERVVREMVSLSGRYRAVKLTAADWIISKKSRRQIWEQLADLDLDVECFYETRADLSKDEFELMRRAGILTVQPGIESLSTELLAHMRKGTSRIRHVRFLRWAREYGIDATYNILAGFPGEEASWYQDMTAFLPRVSHLQPPHSNINYVEMHRFSPLFQQRGAFDVDRYRLREDYLFNFPPGLVDPLKIGYFFNYDSSGLVERQQYDGPLREALQAWLDAHHAGGAPTYRYRIGAGFTLVDDLRTDLPQRRMTFTGLHQDVLLLCDTIQSRDSLRRLLRSGRAVDDVVDELVAADLIMQEGSQLLTLPTGYRPRTTAQLYSYVLGDDVPVRERRTSPTRAVQLEMPTVLSAP